MTTNKLPKFLLCENPIANERHDGRSFVLHTRKPLIIAEIHSFVNMTDESGMEFERGYDIGSRLDYPPETFFFVPVKIIQSVGIQTVDAQQMAGIMRRMAEWYEAYLIWEDSQHEN